MKKVIFSAAALMIGAVALGQTTQQSNTGATVGTASTAASVVLTQPALAPLANKGLAIQNGNDNLLEVRQTGSLQGVYTNQSDGNGIGMNEARVVQQGGVSAFSGVFNLAQVEQVGEGNSGDVEQQGDLNDALIEQGLADLGTADLSKNNLARIQQGNGDQAQNNFAAVTQQGEDNNAHTLQTYDNNTAWTVQNGEDNAAYIRQKANGNQTEGHDALVDQFGDDNASVVNQEGSAKNTARTVVNGDGNASSQIQISTGSAAGDGNVAYVNQGALPDANGLAAVGQFGYAVLDGIVDNIGNPSTLPASGSEEAEAYQRQEGERNLATTFQFGEPGNYTEQYQLGDDNVSLTYQNLYGNPNGGDNYLAHTQDGDANIAGSAQNGSEHKALIDQNGNGNVAGSTQRGKGNGLLIVQDGDDNFATSAQRGVDNDVVIYQDAGQSFVSEQNLPGNNAPVGAPNGNNSIDVIQVGPSNPSAFPAQQNYSAFLSRARAAQSTLVGASRIGLTNIN